MKKFCCLLMIFAFVFSSLVFAEDGDSFSEERPLLGTLRKGDVLRISVFGMSDYDRVVRIDEDGFITFPRCTPVMAAGRTCRQVSEDLMIQLKEQLAEPFVDVFVADWGQRSVYIIGEIQHKGAHFEISPFNRITAIQAISSAGGFTTLADLSKVAVHRYDEESGQTISIPVDVSYLVNGDLNAEDIVLQPEDVIVVPQARRVYVLGQVRSPGPVDVRPGEILTISRAIALAGGFNSIAKRRAVRIIRGHEQIIVNMNEVFDSDEYLESDIDVQFGDTILVSESLF